MRRCGQLKLESCPIENRPKSNIASRNFARIKFSNLWTHIWMTSKMREHNMKKKIVHPNILLYCIITACVIGLLFFVFKIFCTLTHSRKSLFPSCRMREWTNRDNYLAPLGTRSVSLNGINQPATSIEMTPITAMPNIPTFHNV